MTRPSLSWLLRLPTQIALWALLLVAAFGPQRSFSVCTADACCSGDSGVPCDCGCSCGRDAAASAAQAEPTNGEPRPDRNRALGCTDCAVDVALPVELGQPQRGADLPTDHAPCVGFVPPAFACTPIARTPGGWPFGTGPPRPDPRTDLIATTNLRC